MIDILMPQLGESITEGTIVKWLKKPGEFVKKDEPLLEISTDKVDSEIPSPDEGVLAEILAKEEETVEVGMVIARLKGEAGAEKSAAPEKSTAAAAAPVAEEAAAPAPTAPAGAPSGNGSLLDVTMPKLGESITEGTIVRWLKKPGDQVKRDEPLLEISTDKVDSEIPSPFAGILSEILAKENETVEVGAVIARMQSQAGVEAETAAPAPPKPEPAVVAKTPAPAPTAAPVSSPEAGQLSRMGQSGRFYSPLVLNIARTEGIGMAELESVPGTGRAGRVTKQDILGYLERKRPGREQPQIAAQPAAAAPPVSAPTQVAAKWSGQPVEVIPMDRIRKKIAEHMVASKATSPHVYGVAEVDFTNLMNIVASRKEAFRQQEGFKLTVNPFILYAAIRGLQDFPLVNSSLEGDNIIRKKFINIGIAVATEKGLIVPVLKNADELNFRGIARRAYDLAIRARDSKLTVDDIQGSTFTVTNYGVFGNIIGFPIINQPNVAIMGVGAIKKRPVVIETPEGDTIGIRSIGYLTLSYDHRLVDGELGDKFLQRVVYYLHHMTEDII